MYTYIPISLFVRLPAWLGGGVGSSRAQVLEWTTQARTLSIKVVKTGPEAETLPHFRDDVNPRNFFNDPKGIESWREQSLTSKAEQG